MNMRTRINAPAFRFTIGPQYPYKPVISQNSLLEKVSEVSTANNFCRRIGKYCHPVRQGVMSPSRLEPGAPSDKFYFEVNIYGLMTYHRVIELIDTGGQRRYLMFEHVVGFLKQGIALARHLLGGFSLNLRIQSRIDGIGETGLILNQVLTSSYCLDNSTEAEAMTMSDRLGNEDFILDLMVDLASQLLWSYHINGGESLKAEIKHYNQVQAI